MKAWIPEDRQEEPGIDDDDQDGPASGALASMGVNGWLAYIESTTGCNIDVYELDAAAFAPIQRSSNNPNETNVTA